MHLRELFTQPGLWDWNLIEPTHREATFEIEPNAYVVEFDGAFGPKRNRQWTVNFALVGKSEGLPTYQLGRTRTGKPFAVLSTVADIVLDFLQEEQPDHLWFTASIHHQGVYQGMGKLLSPTITQLGYRFGHDEDQFWLERVELKEAE